MKLLKGLALTLLVCLGAHAQNAALMPTPRLQFTDANGSPLAGGMVYTCVAGMACAPSFVGDPPLNALATYTDSTAGVPNANPIVLDSAGRASIWMGSGLYKIVVQDAAGVTQYTQDNVSSTQALKVNGSTFLNYTASGSGAVTRSVAAKLGDTVSVADYPTVANALTAAAGRTLLVPAGTYTTATTLTIPSYTTLQCEPGATIKYTGSGDLLYTATLTPGVSIVGCVLDGSLAGSSANGIHLLAATRARVDSVKVLGFRNNDILNEGTETSTFRNLELDNAKYAIHNVGSAAAQRGVNANFFADILIQNATTWAVYEDGTGFGSNQKNIYDHMTIENSGDGTASSGHVYWQVCDSCEMRSSYIEYMSSVPLQHSIVLGDATHTVKGGVFENNILFGAGQPTFEATRTTGLTLTANVDAGQPTYFLATNANSRSINMRANSANAATGGYITGTDPGDLLCDAQTCTGVNTFGVAAFSRGIGFNQITGMTQDLTIKTRAGGTNVVNFTGSAGGVGSLSDAGKLTVSGDITFHGGFFNFTGSPAGTYTYQMPNFNGTLLLGFNQAIGATLGSISSQSVSSGACVDTGALTFTGFAVGMAIVATPNADAGAWFVQKQIHTDATHFKIQECNMSGSPQTVNGVSFYVRVIQ